MPDVQPIGTVVKMDEADYYKLRTRIADADAAVELARALLAAKDALLKELSVKYGFDPVFTHWQANDEECEMAFS